MTIGFFMAPLILGIVSAVFAALIGITDILVNNYGTCAIDINGGKKKLSINGGTPLLFVLSDEKIYVPSACGGRGSCGACKVVVTSDIGPVLPTEFPYLTDEELKEKTRLACQIKVKKDLEITIPEEIFNVKKLHAMVKSIADVTYDIKEVRFSLPEEIDFKCGQYLQLETPKYKLGKKKQESTMRAYSLSSATQDKNEVEMLVRLVPDGIVTSYVHNFLEQGQNINVIGPFGDFYVRDTDATMVCVAGGSGMAPFKSIMNTMLNDGSFGKREMWYFFGARAVKDLYYVDWLYKLEKEYEKFHFVPALSDPDPNDNWKGPTGLITEVLDGYLKKDIGTNKPREGYLCGSPGMLDACMDVMKDKNGMTEDKIYFDKFA